MHHYYGGCEFIDEYLKDESLREVLLWQGPEKTLVRTATISVVCLGARCEPRLRHGWHPRDRVDCVCAVP